jgi:hypothetical protein
MNWQDDGYNYDDKNNRTGYNGKPVKVSIGVRFIAKLVIVLLLVYGGKSIFGTIPKNVAAGLDMLGGCMLGIFVLIVILKIISWVLQFFKSLHS